jgi:hypothetical protein
MRSKVPTATIDGLIASIVAGTSACAKQAALHIVSQAVSGIPW